MFRKILNRTLKIIAILLVLIILIFTTIFLIELKKTNGDAKKATMQVLQKVANTVVDQKPIYFLCLGISTDMGQSLTDTIILSGYNPQTQKAFMLSIPRDTFIGKNINKTTADDKINSLYSISPETTVRAVEELTGIDIDYYVTVRTETLIQIVDLIGGVEFNVPQNMNYDDKSQNLHIHLKKGLQVLDGDKAEQLLRFRKNNNNTTYDSEWGKDDYGRMRTQREFIMQTVSQCLEKMSLDKIKDLIKVVFDGVETDCSLSYVLSYLTYVYDFDMDNLIMEQLPGESTFTKNEVWVFEHDEEATKELVSDILMKFNNKTPNNEMVNEIENTVDSESENVIPENIET